MVPRGSDDVTVLGVAGQWSQVVDGLHREMLQELALEPRAVVGDLSAARCSVAPDLLGRFAGLGALAKEWPGCAIALTSPDPGVRAELRRQPFGNYVYVAPAPQEAVAAIGREPAPAHAVVQLAPQCKASRTARDFVTRTCRDWKMAAAIPPACLVMSEFVTSGVLHAGTNLEVRLAGLDGLLRVFVRGRLLRTADRGPTGRTARRPGRRTGAAADPGAGLPADRRRRQGRVGGHRVWRRAT